MFRAASARATSSPMSCSSRPGPIGRPATADTSAAQARQRLIAPAPGSPAPAFSSGLAPSGHGAAAFSQVRSQASEISAHGRHPEEVPHRRVVPQRDDRRLDVEDGEPHPRIEVAPALPPEPRSRSRTALGTAHPRRAARPADDIEVQRAHAEGLPEPGVKPVKVGGVSGDVARTGVQRPARGAAQRRGVPAGGVLGSPPAAADEVGQQQRVPAVTRAWTPRPAGPGTPRSGGR